MFIQTKVLLIEKTTDVMDMFINTYQLNNFNSVVV